MRRRLTRLVVFLPLGAIVNVAVAWGCAAWIDPFPRSVARVRGYSHRPPEYERWETWKFERTAALRVRSSWFYNDPEVWNIFTGMDPDPSEPSSETLVPDWADFLHPQYGEPSRGRFNWVADARGWPMLSMWGGCKSRSPWIFLHGVEQPREVEAHSIRAIRFSWKDDPIDWDDFDSRLLPLAPIWPAFAINTAFYAAILWMPFAPVVLRRFIRRKRGHCIKCGYDLCGAEHEVCPECGAVGELYLLETARKHEGGGRKT